MVTSAFLHGGFLHLGFNMFNLKTAGKMVEEFGRPIMYLGTYILCAIAGNWAQVRERTKDAAFAKFSINLRFTLGATPEQFPRPGYGASGAVMGLYGFMSCKFYRYGQIEQCKSM